MRKKLQTVIALIMIITAIAGPFAVMPCEAVQDDAVAAYEAKLKAAQDRKAELEASKAEAQSLVEEYSAEIENIKEYIKELDLKMNDLSLELFGLEHDIDETEAALEQTKLELEDAKALVAKQYATMSARVRYIYENGETSVLEVIFSADNLADMLNQIEYVEKIQEYDNSLLERYNDAQKKVEEKERYLEASLEELNVMREELLFDQGTLNDLMIVKADQIDTFTAKLGIADELLFSYMDEISSQEMEISQIIQDEEDRRAEEERRRKEEEERIRRAEEEKRLAAERAAREKAAKEAAYDKSAIDGIELKEETDIYHMIWPLPGDHRTYSKFGPRKAPTKGASTYHKGWDIGGEFGAPIVATLAGYVTYATYNESAGNYIRIGHGNGFETVYCHCSKLLVSEGDYVLQGTVIGLVGSTGVSTGPHLHFGVKQNDVYIDPDPYIGHLE